MNAVRRRSFTCVGSLVVAVVMSGCVADSGISIDVDEKEARFVRSNVVRTLDRSLDLALEAVDGRKVEQRRRVTSSPCSEWDDGIGVEMVASFVVASDDLGEVVRKIGRALKGEGWQIDLDESGYPTPEALFKTGPRSLEQVIGTVTALPRDPEQGRTHDVVEIRVTSTCIDPSDDGLPVDWPFGPA